MRGEGSVVQLLLVVTGGERVSEAVGGICGEKSGAGMVGGGACALEER